MSTKSRPATRKQTATEIELLESIATTLESVVGATDSTSDRTDDEEEN